MAADVIALASTNKANLYVVKYGCTRGGADVEIVARIYACPLSRALTTATDEAMRRRVGTKAKALYTARPALGAAYSRLARLNPAYLTACSRTE
jgi:hypothetical protein